MSGDDPVHDSAPPEVARRLARLLEENRAGLIAEAAAMVGPGRERWIEPGDVLGRAVLAILSGGARCRDPDRLRAFLIGVMSNVVRNLERAGGWRAVSLDDAAPPASPTFPAGDPLLHTEQRESLQRAQEVMDELLSQRQAEVLWLKEYVGLTWAEVGAVLGIERETAKVHGRRARRKLRAWREAEGGGRTDRSRVRLWSVRSFRPLPLVTLLKALQDRTGRSGGFRRAKGLYGLVPPSGRLITR